MALVQTDHDTVVRLVHGPDSLGPARRLGAWLAQAWRRFVSSIRHQLESVSRWSTRRHARTGLSMVERARQRRELAQLSDRELRDIGISRYEIDFVLRRSSWR